VTSVPSLIDCPGSPVIVPVGSTLFTVIGSVETSSERPLLSVMTHVTTKLPLSRGLKKKLD
jgi:hypothetical protein